MNEMTWLRAYVERLLSELWGVPEVAADDDGDYPFRMGTAAAWVRLEAWPTPTVRVFAHAASGVRRSARMLAELNDLSARSRLGSVYWVNGTVVCSYAVDARAVDGEVLGQILAAVGGCAGEVGTLIAAVFGGATPFDADEPTHHQDEDVA